MGKHAVHKHNVLLLIINLQTTKYENTGISISNDKTVFIGPQLGSSAAKKQQPNWFKVLIRGPLGRTSKVDFIRIISKEIAGLSSNNGRFSQKRLVLTRDLLRLFIELDELDGSPLKKAVPVIRNQPETAREQEVEVIDLDAATNNFDYVTATEK